MKTIFHSPPNTLLCIDRIWMAISVDRDGNEGVCAVSVGGMQMPLIAADEARLPFVRTNAQLIAKQTGKAVRVIRLSTRELIEEYDNDGNRVSVC